MERIQIDRTMIETCYDFAKQIILGRNQYDRMQPTYAKDENSAIKTRIMRTFVGKLGELCFSKFLDSKGIEHDTRGMFDIFEGETNVDEFDFVTNDGGSVDIKTSVFRNHTRLVVPLDQFVAMKKHFYVGVKLNVNMSENRYDLMNPFEINSAIIHGFCSYEVLQQQPNSHLGEFPCKAISLASLRDINELINCF